MGEEWDRGSREKRAETEARSARSWPRDLKGESELDNIAVRDDREQHGIGGNGTSRD